MIFSNLYVFSNFSSKYTFETSLSSSTELSGIENENSFFASDIIAYLIAYKDAFDIRIALLSNLAQFSHFIPSSFMLKCVMFSFSPQLVHDITSGVNPN